MLLNSGVYWRAESLQLTVPKLPHLQDDLFNLATATEHCLPPSTTDISMTVVNLSIWEHQQSLDNHGSPFTGVLMLFPDVSFHRPPTLANVRSLEDLIELGIVDSAQAICVEGMIQLMLRNITCNTENNQ